MKKWHDRTHVSRRLRLRGYDYSQPSMYFLTLCVERRSCLFGDVIDDLMVPNTSGTVVESWWCSIPRRFPSVIVDAYVVMPNHLHGILFLGTIPEEKDGTPSPTLGDVIRWFKGTSTRDYIRGVHTDNWQPFPGRLWQQNFHEHILRSDTELARYHAYIDANPSQWRQDEHHPERLL